MTKPMRSANIAADAGSGGNNMRLVLIEWVDSLGCAAGWRHLEDLTPDILTIRSVGWLLHDRKAAKTIVPHLMHPDANARPSAQGMGDVTIPTRCIVRMVTLRTKLTKQGMG